VGNAAVSAQGIFGSSRVRVGHMDKKLQQLSRPESDAALEGFIPDSVSRSRSPRPPPGVDLMNITVLCDITKATPRGIIKSSLYGGPFLAHEL
jgi:hypothetical protein